MSSDLPKIDLALQEVISKLSASYPKKNWESLRYCSRWTPKGDVGSDDFWQFIQGQKIKASPSNMGDYLAVSNAAKNHWRLTRDLGLPIWYGMTVNLSCDGKYSVDFEYRDDYREGDIMKPLD